MEINEIRKKTLDMGKILGLTAKPVGVKFIFDGVKMPETYEKLSGYRYCQALMRARHGSHVTLDAAGIACPAAAAAFGYKPLPDALKSGMGLMGFGITADKETGVEMFKGMTTLEPGKLKALYLFPLETAAMEPDIVVVEDETEKLMWIVLAELNHRKGRRVESDTAVLQATCVDAAVIPYVKQRLNMSMGCYGCRDATDIGPNETVLGFPFKDFGEIAAGIDNLAKKAIPASRSKNAYTLLKNKSAETIGKSDPFQG